MAAPLSPESRPLYKRLECGCVKSYPGTGPRKGENVWCHYHSRMTAVLYTETWIWRAKCTVCRYNRTAHGKPEIGGKAQKHVGRYPDHVIDIFNPEGTKIKSYGGGNQGQLSISDVPLF